MCLVHFKINSQWWTFHYHSTYTFVFALDVQIYLLKIKSNDPSLVFELRFWPLVRRELFGHFWQEEKDSSKKKAFYFLFHLKASMRTLNDVIYMYVSHFHQRDLLRFTYQNKIIIAITCLKWHFYKCYFLLLRIIFTKKVHRSDTNGKKTKMKKNPSIIRVYHKWLHCWKSNMILNNAFQCELLANAKHHQRVSTILWRQRRSLAKCGI